MAASHLAPPATAFLASVHNTSTVSGFAGVIRASTSATSASTPGPYRLRVTAKSRRETQQVQALPKFAEHPQLNDSTDNGSLRDSAQVSVTSTPVKGDDGFANYYEEYEGKVPSGRITKDSVPKKDLKFSSKLLESSVNDILASDAILSTNDESREADSTIGLLEKSGGSKKQKKKDGKKIKEGKKGKGDTKLALAVGDDAMETVSQEATEASTAIVEIGSPELSEVTSEKKEKKAAKKDKEKKEKKEKKGKDGKEKKGKGKKGEHAEKQIVEASLAA